MSFDREHFVVVYARRASGMSGNDLEDVRRTFAAFSPAWVQVLPPEGMLILIPYSVEAAHGSHEAALQASGSRAGDDRIHFGICDGELTVQRDSAGQVEGHPFGMAINEAMKRAVGR